MFDTGVLDDDEVFVDVTTVEKEEQSTKTGEAVTTAGVKDSVAPTIPTTVEETLAQTLMEIKAAKPKAKGIVFHDQEEQAQESNEKKEEGSEEKAKGSRKKMLGRKRAGKEQQQESSKKQRMEEDKETDEVEEVEEDDESEKSFEGIMVHYELIRADGSSKRYSSMIRMIQDIDREDLLTLWKLVKTKHGDIRLEDDHERVLWGDFKVMLKRSKVWRDLQVNADIVDRSIEIDESCLCLPVHEHVYLRIMSSSTHPIIILSDSNVEDAFSSTNTPNYTLASPDYFPASPGNTFSDPSEDLSKDLLALLTILPFHDDPYMKVRQAYNDTNNESPIPLPRAPIAPLIVLPPSLVLPSSPLFDP
ncbi:hypothetical protein Tco_1336665 [Tanacetum coccineum]